MSNETVVLYGTPFSQPCRAVLFFILERGIPHEYVFTDLASGRHHRPDLVELNPNKYVPIIKLKREGYPDFVMCESNAILRFLALWFNCDQGPLVCYPSDLLVRARIDQLMDWKETTLRRGISMVLIPTMVETQIIPTANILMTKTTLPPKSEALQVMLTALAYLDGLLGAQPKSKWVAGTDDPTIADISLGCEISQLLVVRYPISQKFPNIALWMERVEALASFATTHKFFKRFGLHPYLVTPKL